MRDNKLNIAVQQLPVYQPPSHLWERIEQDLSFEEKLGESLENLPQYTPPERVWQNIQSDLTAKRVSLQPRWIWLVAASVAVLMITLFAVRQWSDQPATVEMIYATRQQEPTLFLADWNEEEAAFSTIATLCKQHPFICESATFQENSIEMELLNEEKLALEQAMQQYGKQANLINQMRRVEQGRSDLLKEMIAAL